MSLFQALHHFYLLKVSRINTHDTRARHTTRCFRAAYACGSAYACASLFHEALLHSIQCLNVSTHAPRTHSRTHALDLSHSLSLSHTHAHAHARTHTHTHCHIYNRAGATNKCSSMLRRSNTLPAPQPTPMAVLATRTTKNTQNAQTHLSSRSPPEPAATRHIPSPLYLLARQCPFKDT